MEKTETKDLNYYKNNCEEDYIKTPISVLRYISELEAAINYTHSCKSDSEQLQGFFDYYKKKFGNGFSTDVLEITLKKYKETL